MKCINMKIIILFLTANFISIKSLDGGEDKTTNIVVNKEISKNKLDDEDCPDLVKMIRNNGLSNYTINCEAHSTKSQGDVLQHACFVVKNMFSVVCNKRFNETSLDLLGRNNTNNVCPFNFSHLKLLGLDFVFTNHELVSTLTHKDDCERICYELYSSRTQCVLLSKFNEYIKTQNLDKFPANPQVADIGKSGETTAGQPSKKPHFLYRNEVKNILPKTKTETVANQLVASTENSAKISKKEKKTEKPVMTTTPKEEIKSTEKAETPQVEVKVPDTDSYKPVSKNSDKFTEGEFSDDNSKDILQKIDDPLLNKAVVNQDSNSQKMQNFEDKESPYLKEKDSYVGERFSHTEDSHFFFYFVMMSSVVVVGYLAFHNKNKILAYALEGSSSRRSRRRPNPARYRKLETNLEEAISSSATNATTSSVVY